MQRNNEQTNPASASSHTEPSKNSSLSSVDVELQPKISTNRPQNIANLYAPSTSAASNEQNIIDNVEEYEETDVRASSSQSQNPTSPKQRTHFAMPSLSQDSLDSVVRQYREQFTTPEPTPESTSETKHSLDVAWKQQTLPAWQPQYRPATIVSLYLGFGVVMLAMGIPMLLTMNRAHEVVVDYTNCIWDGTPKDKNITCADILAKGEPQCKCKMNFKLEREFKLPVYIYYELDGFYQNHRRYVASVDYDQLYGRDVPIKTLESNCAPYAISKNNSLPYGPCGAIANSFFLDEFKLINEGARIEIYDNGITWPTDKALRYRNPNDWSLYTKPENWLVPANELEPDKKNAENNGYQNEHFIVWMRTAAFPKFRKLWGRILPKSDFQSLKKGDYTVHIDYNYKTVDKKLNIPKRFVLATSTWLGGRNLFLPILYIVCGAISIITGIFFLILTKRKQNSDRHRTDTVSLATANYQTMARTAPTL